MPGSGACTSIINLRYQDGREGSPSNPAKFNRQDHAQLRDACVRRGRPFVDNTFPPNARSLGQLYALTVEQEERVEWLRPADILKMHHVDDEPVFCQGGASRFDFGQGVVSNCWFLAAVSSLTCNEQLTAQVVPMDQAFADAGGIFHFRFWRFGMWLDVVIDDHLPTLDHQLLSVHSNGVNEFWVPLLEKAYAKVCGSYADMNIGIPSEACKDFTGGVNMSYGLGEAHREGHDDDLWLSLTRASGCKSMICCGTPPAGETFANTVAHTGLVDAHAYSVTGVTEVEYNGSKVKLVRILNPWGEQEWTGKWSDRSGMWKKVSPTDQEKHFNRNDGEFWMELEDFCHNFNMVSMCCENPNFIDGDLTCQWKCMIYDGSWAAGKSAGGAINADTFHTNPQYRIQVTIIDEKEPGDKNILLSLMQKPLLNRQNRRFYQIGLTVFKIPPGTPQGRLKAPFFRANFPVKEKQLYSSDRELIEQHSLEPGEYVIVASTQKPYMTADFVLTVYTKAEAKISAHDGHDDDDDDDDHEHHGLIHPQIPGKSTAKDPVRALFDRFADQNGELIASQLQRLLNDNFAHATPSGFDLNTCSSMIAMMDIDQRMTMTFTEFSVLWKKMHEYKRLFHRSDLNQNGCLSDRELQKAIEAAGMSVNDFTVRRVIFRYSGFSSTTLKNFITLMMRLENSSKVFKNKSSEGMIHLTWEEWSNISLYN
ncbi:calpain-9 [Scophthalmus maximus]|uniref:calpain-9 n=1 Tax=Scophthalmus maximus TaxID=52904 RepID=UPI001FA84900|nr:calpain-9 [Scophthalmus maximus]XP_035480726.2 calpain-9 [Scophthalmus maximus]